MQKTIEMLGGVKNSIINAYEIKTGQSRAKLSHLMDAETWMDSNKAIELGFADGILKREDETDEEKPAPLMFSRRAVTASLLDKVKSKTAVKSDGRRVDALMERLRLMKY